ncbi:MAG TPA: dihydrofolate reductase [Xanthomonadaceae bacterium]|nr:dihydrofolate reductase [Xanthomonadaceae bacterium]
MPELALIAALDRHRAIGRGNALPWHLPADLKRFKALTLGGTVLMGRRTAEAIGRALPGRSNLVLSHGGASPVEGMQPVRSLGEAMAICGEERLWVIGGEQVYRLALPLAEWLFLTWVDTAVEGADAYFPAFDADDFEIIHEVHHPADARHPWAMRFVDYRRRQGGNHAR